MREKVMMILAIIVFACVPMVQLVAADSVASTPDQDQATVRFQSLNTGLNLNALLNRFNMSGLHNPPRLPDVKFKQLFEKKLPAWSELKNRTTFTPRVLPTPSNSVFPTPTPTPETGMTQSPVYLSALDVSAEYLKITNNGNEKIIMTGWKISNREGGSFTFIDYPQGNGQFFTYTLMPHSTVTIHTGMEGNPSSLHLYWPEEMWNDAGDTAYLYNPEGVLVSTLTR